MRSGRFASSRAMTRMDRSGALPRTLYALVSFGAAVMTVDSGQAEFAHGYVSAGAVRKPAGGSADFRCDLAGIDRG